MGGMVVEGRYEQSSSGGTEMEGGEGNETLVRQIARAAFVVGDSGALAPPCGSTSNIESDQLLRVKEADSSCEGKFRGAVART